MKIGAISMIRNEADIISTWLRHVMALFDYVIVTDHMSDDGTSEFLRAVATSEPKLRVLRYCEPSYDQNLVLNFMRRQVLIDAPDIDWLFVLDADEFLKYPTRQDLVSALDTTESYDVLTFQWRNFFPVKPGPLTARFEGQQATSLSQFGKVALRSNVVADPDYQIPKGAHCLQHRLMGTIRGYEFGEIIHVPIRSVAQIWEKVLSGCESYLHIAEYKGREGNHWFDLLNHMLSTPISWSMVPSLVHEYGVPRSKVEHSRQEADFSKTTINIASIPASKRMREASSFLATIPSPAPLRRLARLIELDRGRFLRSERFRPDIHERFYAA